MTSLEGRRLCLCPLGVGAGCCAPSLPEDLTNLSTVLLPNQPGLGCLSSQMYPCSGIRPSILPNHLRCWFPGRWVCLTLRDKPRPPQLAQGRSCVFPGVGVGVLMLSGLCALVRDDVPYGLVLCPSAESTDLLSFLPQSRPITPRPLRAKRLRTGRPWPSPRTRPVGAGPPPQTPCWARPWSRVCATANVCSGK